MTIKKNDLGVNWTKFSLEGRKSKSASLQLVKLGGLKGVLGETLYSEILEELKGDEQGVGFTWTLADVQKLKNYVTDPKNLMIRNNNMGELSVDWRDYGDMDKTPRSCAYKLRVIGGLKTLLDETRYDEIRVR